MQTRNPILDDLARVASGALGVAGGLRKEAEELLRMRFAAILASADFVSREEFDVAKAMVVRARTENEALEKRIAALEKVLAQKKKKAAKKEVPVKKKKAAKK